MTYSSGPYGQGFGGQPGPPQPRGYPPQPGFPQPGGYQPQPYGMAPPAPSSVTGMIAAILAGLGGLAGLSNGLFAVIGVSALGVGTGISVNTSSGFKTFMTIALVIGLACGVLLLAGSVMLLQRKMLGRWLTVAGCAICLLSSLATFGYAIFATSSYGYGYGYYRGGFYSFLGLAFPIATIVLAMLPSTTAWIRAAQNPVSPQHYSPFQ